MVESIVLAAIVAIFLLLVLVSVTGWLQLRQIHQAVNSNMTAALNKIDELHARLADIAKKERMANEP